MKNNPEINLNGLDEYNIIGLNYQNPNGFYSYDEYKTNVYKVSNCLSGMYLDTLNNSLDALFKINDSALKNKSNRSMFIGENLNVAEIKLNLKAKGIPENNIKIVTNIKDLPFHIPENRRNDLKEIAAKILELEYKDKISTLHLNIIIVSMIDIFDAVNNGAFPRLNKLTKEMQTERKIILNMINNIQEKKYTKYEDIDETCFNNYDELFNIMKRANNFFRIEMDNYFQVNEHYICNFNSIHDIVFTKHLARYFNVFSKLKGKTKNEDFIKYVMDGKNINNYEIEKVIIFADNNSNSNYGMNVFGCSERHNVNFNGFFPDEFLEKNEDLKANYYSFFTCADLTVYKGKSKMIDCINLLNKKNGFDEQKIMSTNHNMNKEHLLKMVENSKEDNK